ncbi:MAG: ATP synthase F1 subunit epsilon [Acidimicrobiia bacterium]|nr:ATP synthase F1 subunit epsilon [Acidimicrobiia bacterium]
MAMTAQLVSPERVLYEGEAEMVVCRTTDGEIAFLPGHVPFVGALGIAAVRIILPEKGEVAASIHGGFIQVSHDTVTILSDVAELPDQIDVVRAQTAKEAAERSLSADPENPEAKAALARAELRLEVANPTAAHA